MIKLTTNENTTHAREWDPTNLDTCCGKRLIKLSL